MVCADFEKQWPTVRISSHSSAIMGQEWLR